MSFFFRICRWLKLHYFFFGWRDALDASSAPDLLELSLERKRRSGTCADALGGDCFLRFKPESDTDSVILEVGDSTMPALAIVVPSFEEMASCLRANAH